MQIATDAAELRATLRGWREQGRSVGLVPTMGSLHAGHLSLLEAACARMDRVAVSIFVNPTQFGPGEDYARYPRDPEGDRQLLAGHGCDLLFAPSPAVIYPFGIDQAVRVHVPGITTVLEGAHRPGHFDGVSTVVTRLMHLVAPDIAVFGKKDYQQWRVIQRLVRDLSLPVEVLGAPIRRESDGLAMSSRNRYLSARERRQAPELRAVLGAMQTAHAGGDKRARIEAMAIERLQVAGFVPDYAVLRRAHDLTEPETETEPDLVALIAARLGSVRLIDNVELD